MQKKKEIETRTREKMRELIGRNKEKGRRLRRMKKNQRESFDKISLSFVFIVSFRALLLCFEGMCNSLLAAYFY